MAFCWMHCRFEKAMQAAQTMWAYTSDGKMVCAYDYIWFGFYNKTGVVSEVAMRADTMVSTADLETATPKQATLRFMVSNMWLPVVGALRTLTSVALPGEGRVAASPAESCNADIACTCTAGIV